MYIIETKQLKKEFRHVCALQGIDLALEPGHIYGLVGNNGAGKTTLFRILAGLARPTDGSISLFGESTPKGLNEARKRTGFLIENAVYYATMSARSNLRNVQALLGGGKKERITEVLEQVGLDPNSRQLVGNYSMGMKQRYGIAVALIGDPELLVLDEPLNGLDPNGALEINALLRSLRAQGKTILLSSHLLSELSKTATDFIFMDHGKIIQQITHRELQQLCNFHVTIHTQDPAKAAEVLRQALGDAGDLDEMELGEQQLVLPYCNETSGVILQILNDAHIGATVETQGIGLEDYFRKLLGVGL